MKEDIQDFKKYLKAFDSKVQSRLRKLRALIRKSAPKAQEVISYQMPAFKGQRILVYFAAYSRHIGFYPGAAAIEKFKKEIKVYKWAKGSVQFPHDEALPSELITKIVLYRVREDVKGKSHRTTKKK